MSCGDLTEKLLSVTHMIQAEKLLNVLKIYMQLRVINFSRIV